MKTIEKKSKCVYRKIFKKILQKKKLKKDFIEKPYKSQQNSTCHSKFTSQHK